MIAIDQVIVISVLADQVEEYQLCHLLEWEARRCYEARCSNNIYTQHR